MQSVLKNIDSDTRLDSVNYRNGSINYNFTINVRRAIVDTVEFQSKMKVALLADLPKNNLSYLMKENEIDLNYVYFDKDGKYICGVHLHLYNQYKSRKSQAAKASNKLSSH